VVLRIFSHKGKGTYSTQSAPIGHAGAVGRCPLFGVDRKWLADAQNDANDPSRKWGSITVQS
jgi:hypothetical protein